MVTPGNNFKLSDLTALATLANAVTSTNYDLTNFYDVNPMYPDNTGANYGYRTLATFKISAPGSGYVIGDTISISGFADFKVLQVSDSGGIVGLLQLDFTPYGPATSGPTWETDNDPSSPQTVSGGTGTGAQIGFTCTKVGPTPVYNFPDYSPGATLYADQYYIVSGGSGYVGTDTITVAGQAFTVATVGGGGVVTGLTLSAQANLAPFPATPAPAAGGSGTGLIVGFYYVINQRPQWLTELNRLRNAIWNLPLNVGTGTFSTAISLNALCVSGPWPTSGPTDNFANTWFYFEGSGATISMASAGGVATGTFGTTTCTVIVSAGGTGYTSGPGLEATTMEVDWVIGGTSNVNLSGVFTIFFGYNRGGSYDASGNFTPDTVVPASLISVSGNMMGTFSVISSGSPSTFGLQWAVSGSYAPGRYKAILTFTNPPSDAGGTLPFTTATRVLLDASGSVDGEMGFTGTCSYSITGPVVSKPGIDSANPVNAIQVPGDLFANGPILYGSYNARTSAYLFPPYPQPVFAPEVLEPGGAPTWTTSVPGVWSAMTNAINSLAIQSASLMPWNLKRTKGTGTTVNPMLLGDLAPTSGVVSNSYNQFDTIEQQQEPPSWAASTYFTSGFTILDSNGNFQQCTGSGLSGSSAPTWPTTVGATVSDNATGWKCIKVVKAPDNWIANTPIFQNDVLNDSNGNLQVAQTAGYTGTTEPTWAAVGSITTDGTVTWKTFPGSQYSSPAQHRLIDIPRYPSYWQSETLARLQPPTGTSGLTVCGANNQWQRNSYSGGVDPGWQQDNLAKGWWIYSIRLNRQFWATSQVSVTIGCIRSGSFVSFGTYNTGQTYQVLWPIFTSDALVYQCTERVDVQAVAIGNPGMGLNLADPALVAAFVNDTAALLALIT